MTRSFIFLPHLEGDAWVRPEDVAGLYRAAGATRTEVHMRDGSVALTDLPMTDVIKKIVRSQ